MNPIQPCSFQKPASIEGSDPQSKHLSLEELRGSVSEILHRGFLENHSIDHMSGQIEQMMQNNPEAAEESKWPSDYTAIKNEIVAPFQRLVQQQKKEQLDREALHQIFTLENITSYLGGFGCGFAIATLGTPAAPLSVAGIVIGCGDVSLDLYNRIRLQNMNEGGKKSHAPN